MDQHPVTWDSKAEYWSCTNCNRWCRNPICRCGETKPNGLNRGSDIFEEKIEDQELKEENPQIKDMIKDLMKRVKDLEESQSNIIIDVDELKSM